MERNLPNCHHFDFSHFALKPLICYQFYTTVITVSKRQILLCDHVLRSLLNSLCFLVFLTSSITIHHVICPQTNMHGMFLCSKSRHHLSRFLNKKDPQIHPLLSVVCIFILIMAQVLRISRCVIAAVFYHVGSTVLSNTLQVSGPSNSSVLVRVKKSGPLSRLDKDISAAGLFFFPYVCLQNSNCAVHFTLA